MALWSGCATGALLEADCRAKLGAAGFADIDIEPVQVFDRADVLALAADDLGGSVEVPDWVDRDATALALDGAVMSAFVRAHKPAA
jgi:hypothetical protein